MNGNGRNWPRRCALLHPLLCSDPRKQPRPLTPTPVAPRPPSLYKFDRSFQIAYHTPSLIHAPRLPLWRENFFAGVPTAAAMFREFSGRRPPTTSTRRQRRCSCSPPSPGASPKEHRIFSSVERGATITTCSSREPHILDTSSNRTAASSSFPRDQIPFQMTSKDDRITSLYSTSPVALMKPKTYLYVSAVM
nr:uncharacterized protein LOC127334817 isoform X2 [Lolium perenne]